MQPSTKIAEKLLSLLNEEKVIGYHGTVNSIDQFFTEPDQFNKTYAGDHGPVALLGAFFSSDKDVASSYPFSSPMDSVRSVVAKELDIKNPKVFKNMGAIVKDIIGLVGEENFERKYRLVTSNKVQAAREIAIQYKGYLKSQGYDSIVFKEGPSYHPNKRGMQADTYIVFNASQISNT